MTTTQKRVLINRIVMGLSTLSAAIGLFFLFWILYEALTRMTEMMKPSGLIPLLRVIDLSLAKLRLKPTRLRDTG